MPLTRKPEDLTVDCIRDRPQPREVTGEMLDSLAMRAAESNYERRMLYGPQCPPENTRVIIHPRSPRGLLSDDNRHPIALAQLRRYPTVWVHEMSMDQIKGK